MDMEPIKKYIGKIEYDANFYGVLAAIIIGLLTVVLYFLFQKKRVSRKNVLITGLSEAGKTVLYSKLVSSKNVITYTSMKENISVIRVDKKKTLTIVDIPGNERLRNKYVEEFLPLARGIIFVVDSFNFSREIRDVAEFLFHLLQEPQVHDYRIPFLIACNKQDHAVAKSAKVIQSQTEKEINALRITQAGRLASSDGKVFLGHKGKEFQFSDLKNVKIEFLECSAHDSGSEMVDQLKAWLLKIA